MAPGAAGLPGRALCPDVADHQHDPREPPPPRRRSPSSTTSSGPSSATCLSQRFARGRSSTGALGSHNVAYERVRGLMASESLFDISREPQKVRDRLRADPVRRAGPGRPPAGRGGRAVRPRGAGLVGQPRPELRDPPGDGPRARPRHGDPARRPGAARAAREHAGDHARRVRPHARDQPAAWAATTSPPPGARRSRAAASAAARSTARPTRTAARSSTARSAPPSSSPPSTRRWASTTRRHYMVGSRPVPLTEPGHRADPRGARLTAVRPRPKPPTVPTMLLSRDASDARAQPGEAQGRQAARRATRSSSPWPAGPARALFFGGSDFQVYDVDLDEDKPEAAGARAGHDSYVTSLALAGATWSRAATTAG